MALTSQFNTNKAFTLAELLIALAILGVIATFTIPKILGSGGDSQRNAIVKEAISAITIAVNEGAMTGDINGYNNGSYVYSRMNSAKGCSTDSEAQGCWTAASPPVESGQLGFVMHNGIVVMGLNDFGINHQGYNGFIIDYNGTNGPNSFGDDWLYLYMCFNGDTGLANTCVSTTHASYTGSVSSGDLYPPTAAGGFTAGMASSNYTLWESIFGN